MIFVSESQTFRKLVKKLCLQVLSIIYMFVLNEHIQISVP